MDSKINMKELMEIYCNLIRNQDLWVDASVRVILCIILLLNIGIWLYKFKRDKKPKITLDA